MLNMLLGETGVIPVRVRRREALSYRHSYRVAAKPGTGPLEISEKAGGLCAKSEYPGSETHTKTARHGFVGNTI